MRRQTPRSVTLDAGTEPGVHRISAPASTSTSPSRSTAVAAPAATRRPAPRRDAHRADRRPPRRRTGVRPTCATTRGPGMVVGLDSVGGDFALPTERPRRILFVSGGSGITPVMSMLRTLRAEGFDRRDRLHPLRAQRRGGLLRATSSPRMPGRAGAARLHPRRARATSTAASAPSTWRAAMPDPDAGVRLRAAALWSTPSATHLRRTRTPRASSRPCSTSPAEASGGRVHLRRQRRRASTTTAGRCWSRPRTPA